MIAYSDHIAAEHLQVHTADPQAMAQKLRNYGSLFIGELASVVYSDKCVGTNHTLPTMGAGRYTGGLWVGAYVKIATHQWLDERGVQGRGARRPRARAPARRWKATAARRSCGSTACRALGRASARHRSSRPHRRRAGARPTGPPLRPMVRRRLEGGGHAADPRLVARPADHLQPERQAPREAGGDRDRRVPRHVEGERPHRRPGGARVEGGEGRRRGERGGQQDRVAGRQHRVHLGPRAGGTSARARARSSSVRTTPAAMVWTPIRPQRSAWSRIEGPWRRRPRTWMMTAPTASMRS